MALQRANRVVKAPTSNVIVVEGDRREYRYFEQAIKHRRDVGAWRIISAHAGDPVSLTNAVNKVRENADRVFIVSDGDRRPPFCSATEAKHWRTLDRLCASSQGSIRLILSMPCVEVWFLMHFVGESSIQMPEFSPTQLGQYAKRCAPFKEKLHEIVPYLDRRPIEDWRHLNAYLPAA